MICLAKNIGKTKTYYWFFQYQSAKLILLGLILLIQSLNLSAQSAPNERPVGWGGGFAYMQRSSLYRQGKSQKIVVPVVTWQNEKWQFQGIRLNYLLTSWETKPGLWGQRHQLQASLQWIFPPYRAKQSPYLHSLRRKGALATAIGAQGHLSLLAYDIQVMKDVLASYSILNAHAFLGLRIFLPLFKQSFILPGFFYGFEHISSSTANYFYGVKKQEEDLSIDRYSYKLSSQRLPVWRGTLLWIFKKWSLVNVVSFRKFTTPIWQSPIVEKKKEVLIFSNLSYLF